MIFGLEARPPIGIILGFVSNSHEVTPLMQTISHATRAYIVNADGLPGFLVDVDIIEILKAADESEELEHCEKW